MDGIVLDERLGLVLSLMLINFVVVDVDVIGFVDAVVVVSDVIDDDDAVVADSRAK